MRVGSRRLADRVSVAREWTVVWALTAYDIVLEPVVRGFKRGWALGKARAR